MKSAKSELDCELGCVETQDVVSRRLLAPLGRSGSDGARVCDPQQPRDVGALKDFTRVAAEKLLRVTDPRSVAAVIPAYCEEKNIAEVIRRTRPYVDAVVVVDDGSPDQTGKEARSAGATVIRHQKNSGKGAAIKSGVRYVFNRGFGCAILLDGDGQHCPEEIPRFLERAAHSEAALIIGSRVEQAARMPWLRRCVNWAMSRGISRGCGQAVADSQCGFRLVRHRWEGAMCARSNHFEYETAMILDAVRAGWRIEWVPVSAVYLQGRSKISPVIDTLRFFSLILRWWLEKKRLHGAKKKMPAAAGDEALRIIPNKVAT